MLAFHGIESDCITSPQALPMQNYGLNVRTELALAMPLERRNKARNLRIAMGLIGNC